MRHLIRKTFHCESRALSADFVNAEPAAGEIT